MSDDRFDELSKALATSVSRGRALKAFALAGAGGVLSLIGAGSASARQCRDVGSSCRSNAECCDRFCDTNTFKCACPSGTNLCPRSNACLPACQPPFVFNAATCACECPAGTQACGTTCCATNATCCAAASSSICCPSGLTCCSGTSFATCCSPSAPRCCVAASGFPFCCPPNLNCGPFGCCGPPGSPCGSGAQCCSGGCNFFTGTCF
jgi:hypothetical protein